MKRILVHRNQIVAMASRKQWKKYWGKFKICVVLNLVIPQEQSDVCCYKIIIDIKLPPNNKFKVNFYFSNKT